ncbi:MAG: prepilin-type N-terminal cleavage/methylation domain-containing protein [Phycisphaerales bacterium]|nr:prepilin-type N-terminal cleavage/methylation domain-containing protein [Phycisphaerales bacterium]
MKCMQCPSGVRNGFTLLEVLVVVTIMSIIAVSAVPTLGVIGDTRKGSARDEVIRMLEYARARAVASGRPCGVQVLSVDSTMTMVQIASDGSIEPMLNPFGIDEESASIAVQFPGVEISSIDAQTDALETIWFTYNAQPHSRNADGTFGQINTGNASITLSSGDQILVYAYSGFVEMAP